MIKYYSYILLENVVKYETISFIASGYANVNLTKDLTFTFNANANANAYDYDRWYTYMNSPFADYYTDSSNNGYLEKARLETLRLTPSNC